MKLIDYYDKILKTQDDFVIVNLKSDTQFNERYAQIVRQFAGSVFVNIRDSRYTESPNVLAYDVKGFIPLTDFLLKHVFVEKEIEKICFQAANLVMELKKANLSASNIIWNPDNIFVNDITYDMRFLFLPIETTVDPEQATVLLCYLIKKILFDMKTERYYTVQGKVLSFVNHSEGFDPARFAHELKAQNQNDAVEKTVKHRNNRIKLRNTLFSVIAGNLFTLIIFYFFEHQSIQQLFYSSSYALVSVLITILFILVSGKKNKSKDKINKQGKIDMTHSSNEQSSFEQIPELSKEIKPQQQIPTFKEKTVLKSKVNNQVNKAPVQMMQSSLNNNDEHIKNYDNVPEMKKGDTQSLFEESSNSVFLIQNNSDIKICIDTFPFVIGAGGSVNLQIDDGEQERQYAYIDCIDGEYIIVILDFDLNSSVNGIAIKNQKPFVLSNGDQITIADSNYQFSEE